jgi:hypothetical protein
MKKIIELGKIDYNGFGCKINLATLDVELKETEKGLVFTMSGNIWNSKKTDIIAGGQICDEMLNYFKDKKTKRLVEIWKNYHLNDMNAGTIEQETALQNYPEKDYTKQCEYLKSIGLYEDNGYKYGSAWLFRSIPEDIINEIKNLVNFE